MQAIDVQAVTEHSCFVDIQLHGPAKATASVSEP